MPTHGGHGQGLEMGAGRGRRKWCIPALIRMPPCPDRTPSTQHLVERLELENCGLQAAGPTHPKSYSRGREKSSQCLA